MNEYWSGSCLARLKHVNWELQACALCPDLDDYWIGARYSVRMLSPSIEMSYNWWMEHWTANWIGRGL